MSLKKNEVDAAVELIEPACKIVIGVHERPDADAIGSALALARGLRSLSKTAVVLSQDGVPETCQWLSDVETVRTETTERDFDLAILCDCDGPDRSGSAKDVHTSAKSLLIIDHHLRERETENALAISDVTAAATAELIFEVLHGLKVMMDTETAEQLMCAIVGDTGGFRFTNVTATTLEYASRLATLGASPSRAARQIYENRSLKNTRLLGEALRAMRSEFDGRVVWSDISKDVFARHEASDSDTESIVNHIRATKGAEVALLFRETEDKLTRVSLRSWGTVDVNQIARKFGGGGHAAAAGVTIEKPLAEAEDAVLTEVRAWMAS